MPKYNSLYGAKVVSTKDPEHRGRIKIMCAEVLGETISNWCEPCFQGAHDDCSDFLLPKIGEFVWVMFEEGDVDSPVYLGGWWSEDSTPLGIEYKKRGELRYITFGDMSIVFDKEGNKITTETKEGSDKSLVTITPSKVTVETKDSSDKTVVEITPSKVTVKGKVYVEDNTTIKGKVSVDGNASINGNLNVSGVVSAINI